VTQVEPLPQVTPARNAAFATTRWSVVLSTLDGDPGRARLALEQLFVTYWYPLYAFLRRRGHQPADAEDLVQGFIAHVLERDSLRSVNADKGRFRSYLLACLNHFVADTAARAGRLKRGAGRAPLSLDAAAAERRYGLEPADPATPEQLYERRWALTLLDTVLQRLEGEAEESGRGELFRQIKGVLVGDRSGSPYARLSEQLGLSVAALAVTVHRLRRRYRELVREEIAHTVSHPAEVDEEMRHLFQVLAR
jgi:RNA polymerase sigma-70 factor (ECF subfamily)